MNPSAITIRTINPRRRTDVLAGRVYVIPVVRELPRPAADAVGDHSW
jgi:hypothetical protein